MGLAGTLDLRHVSAVDLDMTSPWQRLDDMPREGDRDEPVASTPAEQRIGLQPAQAGPEAVLAVGFLQLDMARRERRRRAVPAVETTYSCALSRVTIAGRQLCSSR